jgi:hypothetical protein
LKLLRKCQHLARQTGHALPQGVVARLDMIGLTCHFADRLMLRRGNDPLIHHMLIGVKCGVVTVHQRNLDPQTLGTLAAAIPHMKGNDLTCLGVHRDPNPLLVALLLHEARHFVRFDLKALNHPVLVRGDGLNVQMIRQRLNAVDEKA